MHDDGRRGAGLLPLPGYRRRGPTLPQTVATAPTAIRARRSRCPWSHRARTICQSSGGASSDRHSRMRAFIGSFTVRVTAMVAAIHPRAIPRPVAGRPRRRPTSISVAPAAAAAADRNSGGATRDMTRSTRCWPISQPHQSGAPRIRARGSTATITTRAAMVLRWAASTGPSHLLIPRDWTEPDPGTRW